MKLTLGWLNEHLDTDESLDTVVETLTRIGHEVESVANPAAKLAPFTIACVLTAEPHAQADKLSLLSVDTGAGAPVQVVCGAPNARAGLVGVFGGPGAHVPGSDLTLKVATIRGVESRGMMCSARELELGEDHAGIIELAEDAPVGASYAAWAGLDDPVIEVAITPNRGDCMGVHGIARDLAAAGLGMLKPVVAEPIEGSAEAFPVRIEDKEGCPAFYAQSIRGVRNGSSPAWLQQRLKAVGQRPISLLVDISNFIMLAYGRPLHFYDIAKLDGQLAARKARAGESVNALNGRSYELAAGMTVIADKAAIHDIAGIMGGAESAVSEETRDILIECAWFDPAGIARTGQALALASDARLRFERGVDPAFLESGLALATAMVLEHAGGEPSPITRLGVPPTARAPIAFDPARTMSLGGLDVEAGEQRAILERLGFAPGDRTATPPTWRHDVDGPADLVEEIVRIAGLDRVAATPLVRPSAVAKPTATPAQRTERRVRRAAAARGHHEAVTWSFVPEADAAHFGGADWLLANPISEELKAMRPSLLPGLLRAGARNLDRGEPSVRLFEIGRCYRADGEAASLALLLAGERKPRGWRSGPATPWTAADAKAEALALLAAAGAPVERMQLRAGAAPHFHPGRSACLSLGPKQVLAGFGELNPRILRAFDIDVPTVAVEIALGDLPKARGGKRPAYDPPSLQSVKRDFAFLAPAELQAGTLTAAIAATDKALIVEARLFDIFTGQGVPDGEKSLAVEVTLQPRERSFTEAELQEISGRVITAAGAVGARLRG